MKYHIVYLTENSKNLKKYVGKHSCSRLDCDYLGSGKLLSRALCKYGRSNFTRENLAVFEQEQEAYEYEQRLVTQEFVDRPDTYNMVCGGRGSSRGYVSENYKLGTPTIVVLITKLLNAEYGWDRITKILSDMGVKSIRGTDIHEGMVYKSYSKMLGRGLVEKYMRNELLID